MIWILFEWLIVLAVAGIGVWAFIERTATERAWDTHDRGGHVSLLESSEEVTK
jgi:hypothetical protein